MPRQVSAKRASQFARSVLRNNLQVKAGENVVIEGWSHSLPWAVALAREARRLKAFPLVLYEDEDAFWDSIDAHEEAILGAQPAHEWAALGKTDVYIHMWGAGDRVRLFGLSESQLGKLFGFNDAWYKMAKKAGLRGARLEVGRPTPSLAKVYGVDAATWLDQIVQATMVDPGRLAADGARLARALERGRRLRIRDDQGTDLTLGLAHRPATVSAGRVSKADLKRAFGMLTNLPSGSVRVALDETVAKGTLVASRSSYYENGKATGGVFEFRRGRLVSHSFDQGGELFEEGFRHGGRGRDRPGQFRIGLNPQLHDTPQVEDLEAGALMVSVGGNQFDQGKNRSPFFGFLVNTGATVEVDDKPLVLPG